MFSNGIEDCLKWIINVVIKLFILVILALSMLTIGTVAFGIDINDLFSGFRPMERAVDLLQHVPRVGIFADMIQQIIESAESMVSLSEKSIYDRILFCCIYMTIVRCFNATIQGLTRVFKRYMTMSKIAAVLADVTVYVMSYALALGMTDLIYIGIANRMPVNVVCWFMAGGLVVLSLTLLILQRKKTLSILLDLVGGGLLDVFQLVLICFAMMCMGILEGASSSVYLSIDEELLLTVSVFTAAALLAASLIRRLIAGIK